MHADALMHTAAAFPSPLPRTMLCPQHLLKDVRLFESEAAAAGLDTRLLAALQAVTQVGGWY